MNKSDRGLKHVCAECGCKYYDLKRKVVACPKCGVKEPVKKPTRPGRPARSGRGFAFRGYS